MGLAHSSEQSTDGYAAGQLEQLNEFYRGRPFRATPQTLKALVSQRFSYVESRKDKEGKEIIEKPVSITPRRLRLASEELIQRSVEQRLLLENLILLMWRDSVGTDEFIAFRSTGGAEWNV